jgi:hypothetical protein
MAGWEEIPDHKWNAYGEIIRIEFDWKLGYEPDLLIVSLQLWIPCGSSDPDSAVYVFQGKARHWELVLAADADFDSLWHSDLRISSTNGFSCAGTMPSVGVMSLNSQIFRAGIQN